MMTWGDYTYINKCECPYCGNETRVRNMEWVNGTGYVCTMCISIEEMCHRNEEE